MIFKIKTGMAVGRHSGFLFVLSNVMIPVSKGQKAVRACTIRLLNLGHAKYEVQNIQWMFVLHRPKRSVDSSDLRSKSADCEYLEVLCASGTRLAPTEAERRPCGSCVAAEQFIGDIRRALFLEKAPCTVNIK